MSYREKSFAGYERRFALDRNAKARIACRARGLRLAGQITRATECVLMAMLWHCHSSKSGSCHPSYEALARLSGSARSTVAVAIVLLERANLLKWVNCLTRTGRGREVRRTANAYEILDPTPKSENPTAPLKPVHSSTSSDPALEEKLNLLERLVKDAATKRAREASGNPGSIV